MALKFKISKEDYEALSDEVKANYAQIGDTDEYRLDLDGYEDPAELRRARDREKQAAREAQQKARELEERLSKLETDDNRKRGDIEALEKSWREQRDSAVREKDEEIKRRDAVIQRVFRNDVANRIARDISTVPVAMARMIVDRLTVEMEDGEPVTRVLDANGKLSAASLDDLKKEFVANPDLAGMIIGSKASGSGANGKPGGGATKKLSEMNDTERRDWYNRDPDGFRKAVAEQTT